MTRAIARFTTMLVMVGFAVVSSAVEGDAPEEEARDILQRTEVRGGLIVHLGCGAGELTAAFAAEGPYLVHGLDPDAERVAEARAHIQDRGVYGEVSVKQLEEDRLPYADNLVNLVVVEDEGLVSEDELRRVLAPEGTAYVRQDDGGEKTVLPWPDTIDEWSHYLHGPNNNAVAEDREVGPPRRLQWSAGPQWLRSHEHLSSFSAMVSAGGRVFYIVDEGPVASVAFPSRWRLVARDAFSGVRLWSRSVSAWESRFRGFRSGPPELARRLVAGDEHVYATLGYGEPVRELCAATGETTRVYEESAGAEEILLKDGALYLLIGDEDVDARFDRARRRGVEFDGGKALMAIEADTGEVMWRVSGPEAGYVMPSTLAVSDGRVFYQNAQEEGHIVCRDAGSGEELWHSERPIIRQRPTWLAPTLVVYDGVVLSADRNEKWIQTEGEVEDPSVDPGHVEWEEDSREAYRPRDRAEALEEMVGRVYALCAESGEQLWECPASETFNAPPDVLVADGLVWTSSIVCASQPGFTEGRDPHTGEVEATRPEDQEFYTVGMGHARCHRSFATSEYAITGRAGVEFADFETGEGIPNHWLRGACQYGFMPANGLLYVPPHPCACYIEAKTKGFNVMAPLAEDEPEPHRVEAENRLVEGPAYGDTLSGGEGEDEWPTYRQNPARDGKSHSSVPANLETRWETLLESPLSSPVMAGGHVYVASIDTHTVHALDAESGERRWSFTAGGRVDSPPTIYGDYVLFGSADGWVYCLDAGEGELVWRFRAAPDLRWVVNKGQLESAWPVHGSVLAQDGAVYFVAGRSSYIDGGMHLYGLDVETGETLFHQRLSDRDPETGLQPRDTIEGTGGLPGALPDILSSDGESIFLRHRRYNMQGEEQPQDLPHLYSSVGFLDTEWWHRTYWIIGTETGSGFGGWPNPGNNVPSGRLLVRNGPDVYGFGRNVYQAHDEGGGSHAGVGGIHYELFATHMEDGDPFDHSPRWEMSVPFWVRAMVVDTEDRLFAAGPPVEKYLSTEPLDETADPDAVEREALGPWYGEYYLSMRQPEKALAAYEGEKGARLWILSGEDGETLSSEYELESPPVFDGMIAAADKLYIAAKDGRIVCMGAQ